MKFKDIKEARHSGGTMSVDDFDVGDKIILTTKMTSGIERRVAKIRSVRRTYVTYKEWYVTKQDIKRHGNEIKDMMTSGQGALWPEDIGQNRYGLMHVEIVERGHKRRDGSLRLQEARYDLGSEYLNKVQRLITAGRVSDGFKFPKEDYDKIVSEFNKHFGQAQYFPASMVYEWKGKFKDNIFQREFTIIISSGGRQGDDENDYVTLYK